MSAVARQRSARTLAHRILPPLVSVLIVVGVFWYFLPQFTGGIRRFSQTPISTIYKEALVTPTAEFVRNPNWQLPGSDLQGDIRETSKEAAFAAVRRAFTCSSAALAPCTRSGAGLRAARGAG